MFFSTNINRKTGKKKLWLCKWLFVCWKKKLRRAEQCCWNKHSFINNKPRVCYNPISSTFTQLYFSIFICLCRVILQDSATLSNQLSSKHNVFIFYFYLLSCSIKMIWSTMARAVSRKQLNSCVCVVFLELLSQCFSWWGFLVGGCEVCCPDSFYLCIAQVVRAGAATSPPIETGDRWPVGLERQREADWGVWRTRPSRCSATTSDPNWTNDCPTKNWTGLWT